MRISCNVRVQSLVHGGEGVPTARGRGDAEMFLDHRVGIDTGSTRPPETQCKPACDCDNPDFPFLAGRLTDWEWRQSRLLGGRLLHYAHELLRGLSARRITKGFFAH